jgi:hypothetical protein
MTTHPFTTFAPAFSLLAVTLSAGSAYAQSTTSQPPPAPVAVASDVEPSPGNSSDQTATAYDGERFCRSHWFAMGHCRDRRWTGPEIMFGADLGFAAMTETGPFGFNKGVGSATEAGPAWGLRAGVEVFPWLGLEARYVGMNNSAQASASPAGSVGFLTTGGEAVVRLTAPIPFVHPYVFGGVGYYDISLVGSSGAQAGSVLHSSSQPGIPMGFGLDVPLTWYLSIDAEATYHFQLGESFSAVTTNDVGGGDITTFNAVLRVRL